MINQKPSRTVLGWCVVNGGGNPFLETVCPLRRQAISAYDLNSSGFDTYKSDRRKYGVQVVRCSITTEPKP